MSARSSTSGSIDGRIDAVSNRDCNPGARFSAWHRLYPAEWPAYRDVYYAAYEAICDERRSVAS